jgi:Spy/CpxP family protein refolding chaperone
MVGYGFMNSMNPMTPGNPMLRGNPWLEKFDFGKHIGMFFKRLHLSDAQKTQLRDLMKKFHDDMKPLVQQFKDANADIIKAANEARRLIVEEVKAGRMTREEAAPKLKKLNDETRDKIKNNPATQTIKASMCALRKNLIDSITGILVGEQVTKWKAFVLLMPNPC